MSPAEDSAAAQADDRLLDQIAAGEPVPGTDLTRLLMSWRRSVHTGGIPVLADTDAAQAAIDRARRRLFWHRMLWAWPEIFTALEGMPIWPPSAVAAWWRDELRRWLNWRKP